MANPKAVAASAKQVLEDYIQSMPVRLVNTSGVPVGVNVDNSGNIGLQGSLTLSPAVTLPPGIPFKATPAAHTAADAQLAAVSGKKNTIQALVVSISGTGTAPTGLNLTIEEDLAGSDTVLWSLDLYGFGLFCIPLPSGGLQQPTANKTLDVKVPDPGASNSVKISGTYFTS